MSAADAERAADLRATVAELETVTWEMERRRLIAPDFGRWQDRARPEFDWGSEHFRYMQRRLDQVTAGELKRVLFQVSVRHGKTENNTTGYSGYRLSLNPETRILIGTYSQKQARKLSRGIRRLARSQGVGIVGDADALDEWETPEGGGLRAVGAGAGVASVNADLIIIDDPIGSRKEAESEAHRNAVWDWITDDILARAEPHTAVLFSMPRWHHDDPAGRMQRLQPGRWTLVDLPCVAENGDVLGRKPGELLWPEFRPQSWVDEMRVDLGLYGFAALVQCRPSPREGGMFKWRWMEPFFVDAMPRAVVARVRYWDTAGTEGGGDYTAGCRVSLGVNGLFYIEHMERFQHAPGSRDNRIRATCLKDRQLGGMYEVGVEEESGVGGRDRTQKIVGKLAGLSVFTENAGSRGSKELAADPVASQMEVGNVRIVRGDWNQAFIEELLAFPNGLNDDQVDGMSGAFRRLTADVPEVAFGSYTVGI